MSHTDRFADTPGSGTSRQTTFTAGERPSEVVVTAIAALTGTPAVALSPLYDAVEPDALDSLFDHAQRTDTPEAHQLAFEYQGYLVTVCGDGTITTAPTAPARNPE